MNKEETGQLESRLRSSNLKFSKDGDGKRTTECLVEYVLMLTDRIKELEEWIEILDDRDTLQGW